MKAIFTMILLICVTTNPNVTIKELKDYNSKAESKNKWLDLYQYLIKQKYFAYFPASTCILFFQKNGKLTTIDTSSLKVIEKEGTYKIDIEGNCIFIKIAYLENNKYLEGKYCSFFIECFQNGDCNINFYRDRNYIAPADMSESFDYSKYLILSPIRK